VRRECRQEIDAHSLPGNLRGCARGTTNDLAPDAKDPGQQPVLLALGRLRGTVSQLDVTQLVSHHAGHFTFTLRGFDHAAVDVHRTAG